MSGDLKSPGFQAVIDLQQKWERIDIACEALEEQLAELRAENVALQARLAESEWGIPAVGVILSVMLALAAAVLAFWACS